eukprot:5501520-Amphidinium_carterae.1
MQRNSPHLRRPIPCVSPQPSRSSIPPVLRRNRALEMLGGGFTILLQNFNTLQKVLLQARLRHQKKGHANFWMTRPSSLGKLLDDKAEFSGQAGLADR